MTQNAVVTKIIDRRTAEVEVERGTACGGNCGSCESCMFQTELHVEARNLIQAKPGQKVVISSKSSRIFGAAFLVYIMPLLFFFAGYAVAALAGAGEGIRILVSFGSLILSAALLVFTGVWVVNQSRAATPPPTRTKD